MMRNCFGTAIALLVQMSVLVLMAIILSWAGNRIETKAATFQEGKFTVCIDNVTYFVYDHHYSAKFNTDSHVVTCKSEK